MGNPDDDHDVEDLIAKLGDGSGTDADFDAAKNLAQHYREEQ